jgi:hypothetical protein
MESQKPRILVLTLAIGADYRRGLAKALDSKRAYCERHGYTYLEAQEEWWNRDRPLAWSKVPLWQEKAGETDKWDYIWISDADVWITNPEIRLEDHVLPLLPAGKDLLLTYDSCQHVNSGNMIVRPGAWAVDFFKKVWEQTEYTYHIWFENAAIIKLLEINKSDLECVEIISDHKRFNSYLQGLSGQPLWTPGDFLVHFAGVYDVQQIQILAKSIRSGKIPRLSFMDQKKIEYIE